MAKIQSKAKGNRVELELAKILTERFGQDFTRVPMSGGWGTRNRDSGIREDAVNLLSGDIMCPEKFKFSVESKGRIDFNFWDMLNNDTKHLEIDDWIAQSENDAKAVGKEPLVYVKVNRRKPFVLFPYEMLGTLLFDKEGTEKIGKILLYGKYIIMRFDYFLELPDNFFFEE